MLEAWDNNGSYNDVALVEMFENPAADGLFYCGWNRGTGTPS
jgi:hypothetical protein